MPAYENLNTWSDPEDKGHIESECMWCRGFKNLLDQVWHITAGRPEDCPQTEQKQLSKLEKKTIKWLWAWIYLVYLSLKPDKYQTYLVPGARIWPWHLYIPLSRFCLLRVCRELCWGKQRRVVRRQLWWLWFKMTSMSEPRDRWRLRFMCECSEKYASVHSLK